MAVLFWVSAIFTKSSTYTKSINIRLVTPDSLVLVNDNVHDAIITLSGKGADLAKVGSFDESEPLEVFVDNELELLTSNEIKGSLSKKISNSKVKIIEVNFSPIDLKLDTKITKIIPIRGNIKVSFSKLHTLKKAIEITPKTVRVTGPKSYVEDLKEWNTIKKTYNNISKSVEDVINLNKPKNKFIKLQYSKANVSIEVEEVSEKKLMIPVKPLDKSFVNSKIVPQHVEITFLVGLSMFEHINKNSFSVVIDVDGDTIQNNNYPVTILKKPKYIKIQSISPRFIQVYSLDGQ